MPKWGKHTNYIQNRRHCARLKDERDKYERHLVSIDRIANALESTQGQEQRDDDKRARREIITILLLIFTVIFTGAADVIFYWTMNDSHENAAQQFTITSGQLNVMKQEGRAWIGPAGFTFADPMSTQEPLKILVHYLNYGREPAKDVRHSSALSLFPLGIDNLAKIDTLPWWQDKAYFDPDGQCISPYLVGHNIVYPSQTAYWSEAGLAIGTQISSNSPNHMSLADVVPAIKDKSRLYVIYGCFVYVTFDTTEYTTWCAMLIPGEDADIFKWHLGFCPFANDTGEKRK